MPARTLNLAQRIVVVIGLGIGLDVFGQWLVSRGSGATGWVAYAPLSRAVYLPVGGLHPWVRMMVWLVLTAVWVLASVALLRSRPGGAGHKEGAAATDNPVT
jgi:heme/copper-type cytochrome/quinol oxidase subunit 1